MSWRLTSVLRNGFGLDLSLLPHEDLLCETEDGEEVVITVSGFELLLPLISIQLIEIIEHE
tara:strand:+ start:1727 stop:1909 length:183 start_codon:yes stop_codon:yes gene_type:complete